MVLSPDVGVQLPGVRSGLTFGMPERDLRRAMRLATVADAFVCGSAWAVSAGLMGRSVTLSAFAEGGLSAVFVSGSPTDGDARCPVAFMDVDLFGRPTAEVIEALCAEGWQWTSATPATSGWGRCTCRLPAQPLGRERCERSPADQRRSS